MKVASDELNELNFKCPDMRFGANSSNQFPEAMAAPSYASEFASNGLPYSTVLASGCSSCLISYH